MTKNISISDEAYKKLVRMKRREKESFTEIIINLPEKIRLSDYFGILSKESGEELERNIMKARETHTKTRKKRIERIAKELSN